MIGKYLDLIPGSLRQLVQLNGKETEKEKGCETLFVRKNFQEGEREDRKYEVCAKEITEGKGVCNVH